MESWIGREHGAIEVCLAQNDEDDGPMGQVCPESAFLRLVPRREALSMRCLNYSRESGAKRKDDCRLLLPAHLDAPHQEDTQSKAQDVREDIKCGDRFPRGILKGVQRLTDQFFANPGRTDTIGHSPHCCIAVPYSIDIVAGK